MNCYLSRVSDHVHWACSARVTYSVISHPNIPQLDRDFLIVLFFLIRIVIHRVVIFCRIVILQNRVRQIRIHCAPSTFQHIGFHIFSQILSITVVLHLLLPVFSSFSTILPQFLLFYALGYLIDLQPPALALLSFRLLVTPW